MPSKKINTVKQLTQLIDDKFHINEDNKLSIDEQYEYLKNNFAELCDIMTNVQEHRSNYITKLSSLHQQYMDTVNDEPNDDADINEPDVDSELEQQNTSESVPKTESKSKSVKKVVSKKNSKRKQKVKEVETNTELTEIEPEVIPEQVVNVAEVSTDTTDIVEATPVLEKESTKKKSKRKSTRKKAEKTKSTKSKKKKVKKEKDNE